MLTFQSLLSKPYLESAMFELDKGCEPAEEKDFSFIWSNDRVPMPAFQSVLSEPAISLPRVAMFFLRIQSLPYGYYCLFWITFHERKRLVRPPSNYI